MRQRTSQPMPDVAVVVRGQVRPNMPEYVRSRIVALANHAHEPILFARAKLTESANPAVSRPAIAQANLDLDGRLVRAQVAAPTMTQAIDLLRERLSRRLDRLARHWEARRGGMPKSEEHEWRHGQEPTRRPGYFPRPFGERRIVRRKSLALTPESCTDAATEMDLMDYDFYLFTDVDTGLESVIYRSGETGYRLAAVVSPTRHPSGRITVSPQPAARLTVAEAKDRLELAGLPFVFFVDSADEHASVLYHRYDGHYGLIRAALDR